MKKYIENRDQIKNGDIILFRGDAFVSRGIRWLDKAPYNHAGLVFEACGRKFVLESTGKGVNPRFLSVVMKKEKYNNFCLIRPTAWSEEQINTALAGVLDSSEQVIEYDHKLIFQIAIKRLINRDVHWDSQRMDICSELSRRYTRFFTNPVAENFEKGRMPNEFITPWDFVLYASPHFEVLFDDYKKPDMAFRERGGLDPLV